MAKKMTTGVVLIPSNAENQVSRGHNNKAKPVAFVMFGNPLACFACQSMDSSKGDCRVFSQQATVLGDISATRRIAPVDRMSMLLF